MSLLTQQRALADLIAGDPSPAVATDPYLRRVASSTSLDLVREIGLWWRAFGIEEWCPLTSALLKQLGRFDADVAAFCGDHDVSQYQEQTGAAFLARMSDDTDTLVRSLSRFERFMLRAAKGELVGVVWIEWDRDPSLVLRRLLTGEPAAASPTGSYRTWVSTEFPHHFEVR